MRTRVKICGITRSQDAEFAAEMGVDAIGLVFFEASPRAVTIAQAKKDCGHFAALCECRGTICGCCC